MRVWTKIPVQLSIHKNFHVPCRAMASLRLDLFTAILFFPLGYVANSFSARRGCTRSGPPLPDVESDVAAQL